MKSNLNRRCFIKHLGTSIAILSLAGPADMVNAVRLSSKKPNIIVFFTDDQVSAWEGGLRVPTIVCGPDVLKRQLL